MRTKVTLILVFLNVALFFFIFYVRPRWVTVDQLRAAQTRVLPPGTTDIRGMEISGGGQTVRIQKQGGDWLIESPVEWPANFHAVDRIIKELQLLEHKTSFAIDVNRLDQNNLALAEYGLEKPLVTITLNPAPEGAADKPQAEAPLVLRIGNPTHVGNRLYVLSPDGARVHVVDRSLASSLAQTIEQLRSPGLFTIEEHEVRSLNIQVSGDTGVKVHVKRENAGRWSLESPVIARANTSAVRQTIGTLRRLELGAFLDKAPEPESDPSSFALCRISIGGNNRSETLLIGAPVRDAAGATVPDMHYARMDRRNALFTLRLPSGFLDGLRSAQSGLRETRLLDVEPSEISSVVLSTTTPKNSVSLQRLEASTPGEPAAWQLVRRSGDKDPVSMPADSGVVQSLLERLSRLSAQRFLSDAPSDASLEEWGFNSPEREVEIRTVPSRTAGSDTGRGAGVQLLRLGVRANRGPVAYAQLDSARYVYEIDSEILQELNMEPLHWRDRRIRTLPAGARIVSVRLVDLSNQKVLLERTLPSDANAEQSATTPDQKQSETWGALLTQLRDLKAQGFVSESFTDTFTVSGEPRTWRFRLETGIELNSGEGVRSSTETLLLSERLGGTRQVAGIRELNSVFLIEQPLMDCLWELTHELILPREAEGNSAP